MKGKNRFLLLLETCHQQKNDDYHHHLYLSYINPQEEEKCEMNTPFFLSLSLSLSSDDDAHRPSHVFICVPQADEMK